MAVRLRARGILSLSVVLVPGMRVIIALRRARTPIRSVAPNSLFK